MVYFRFFCREVLKWKYNYFEANPREHVNFRQCFKRFKAIYRSFKFKELWRHEMDEEFSLEILNIRKQYLERQLKILDESQNIKNDSIENYPNPEKILVNYDREVVRMIKNVRDNYLLYMSFPKTYPKIDEEKKIFLNRFNTFNFIESLPDDIEIEFQKYWNKRISDLCDQEIEKNKRDIRKNWKKLIPYYYDNDINAVAEEFETLLISDDEEMNNENEDIVMID